MSLLETEQIITALHSQLADMVNKALSPMGSGYDRFEPSARTIEWVKSWYLIQRNHLKTLGPSYKIPECIPDDDQSIYNDLDA